MGMSSSYLSSYSSAGSTFSEITDLSDMQENYELLAGKWPEKYNEMIAVVSDPGQISDLLLYSLGFRDTKELKTLITDVMSGDFTSTDNEKMSITYDQLMGMEMKLIDASDCYRYNEEYGTYEDMSGDDAYMREVYADAENLYIVGIAWSEDATSSMSAGIMYLPELTYYVIDRASESELVKKQLADKDTDVFSGKAFDDESEESGLDFSDMITIDEDKIAEAFSVDMDTSSLEGLGDISISLDEDAMADIVMASSAEVAENLENVTTQMVNMVNGIDSQVASAMIEGYISQFTVSVQDAGVQPSGSGSSSAGNASASQGTSSGTDSDSGIAEDDSSETAGSETDRDVSSLTPEALAAGIKDGSISSSQLIAMVQSGQVSVEDLTSLAESGALTQEELTALFAGAMSTNAESAPDTSAAADGEEGSAAEADANNEENAEENFSEESSSEGSGAAEDSAAEADGSASADSAAGSNASENTTASSDYLLLSSNGMSLTELYKQQAMSDAVMEQVVEQMASSTGMELSAENIKKIAGDAYDLYFDSLTPNAMGMVPVEELPDPSEAVAQALENNEALIFEEGYDLAKEYTTLMVAAGVSQAVGQVMTPVMSELGSSLSGLSGLSDLFSGDIMSIDTDKFAEAFQFDMDEDELSRLMESMLTGEDASYANNLLGLGYQDLNEPTSISFYFKDFEAKGNFTDWLEAYNEKAEEDKQLTYSDLTGLLMGSVETIVNSVTYVLIAFVSISLIVSSIMIVIITYISVLERTKEIGILRAIGASKRNISSIFNAETFIIGFLSGLIGIGATYLLNIPINMIIHKVTGNPDITAVLNPAAAVILVVIATLLTMIGGLIPSKSASRKDPVIALRTE